MGSSTRPPPCSSPLPEVIAARPAAFTEEVKLDPPHTVRPLPGDGPPQPELQTGQGPEGPRVRGPLREPARLGGARAGRGPRLRTALRRGVPARLRPAAGDGQAARPRPRP